MSCSRAACLALCHCREWQAVALRRRNRPPGQPRADGLDRTVLPIAEPNYPRETELDARNAKAPPRFEVKPPEGAPNVIVFLIDDIGFGHPDAFGGRHSDADARAARQPGAPATTASTRRPSARRRGWRC